MALLAHGNQPFNATGMSAAQLALLEEERLKRLEEERLKRLAIAQANQTPILQKDVGFNWFGLGNKTSLEEQYNLAGNMYPNRGKDLRSWGEVPFTETATNLLNYIPGVQIGQTAEEWALENIKKQEDANNSQLNWSPAAGPNYNPTVEKTQTVLPGQTYPYDFSSGKQLSDEDFARTYQEGAMEASGGFKIPDWIPGLPNWIPGPYAYKQRGNTIDPELPFLEAIKTKEFWRGSIDELIVDAWNETRFGNTPGLFTSPGEWADAEITRQEEEQEAKRIAESDAGKAAVAREAGVWADREIDRQEAAQAAAKEAEMKAAGIWATDEIVRQETEQLAARRAKEEEMRAAGIWADKAIDAEEKRIVGDISWKGGEGLRTGDLPVTVDTIADRLKEITSPDFTEQNDSFVDSVLRGDGFLGTALEYIGLIDGKGRFKGSEETELNEKEANNSIAKIAELAKQTAILTEQVTAEVANVKNLTEQVDTEVSGLLDDSAANVVVGAGLGNTVGTPSSGLLDVPNAANLDVNLLNTTSTSTDGFTIDRLKNPFSKDNKAWWLEKRPGDIPGNNRAVEFFNALAYIGTPLKYRPAQTPSESLQDRKIKHMNNMMDYSASVASSAASSNQNTFTKLKAAVDSQASIAKSIEGEFYGVKGFFEKSSEIDRKIQARAGEIREKMLIMASEGIYPTKQKVYDNEEAERKRIEAEQKRKEEEEKKKNPKPVKEGIDWWPFN